MIENVCSKIREIITPLLPRFCRPGVQRMCVTSFRIPQWQGMVRPSDRLSALAPSVTSL